MFGPSEPSHKFLAVREDVLRTGVPPTDCHWMNSAGRLALGDASVAAPVLYAFSIYSNHYKREVMEAFLITGADAEHIENVLGIPPDVTDAYLQIFFDLDVFKDRLDLEAYVRGYPEGHDDGYGRELKLQALERGIHFLSATFARNHYEVPASAALKEMINQAYILSKEAAHVPLNSPEAKEARQWAATLLSSVHTLPDVMDAEAGAQDALKIELIMVKQRHNVQEIDPADIVRVVNNEDE